jgi:excisionase family DNA binding protein
MEEPKPHPNFEHHQVFTIAEAGQYLKLSRMSVHRLMKDGKLPVLRLGPRCVRIRRADLLKLVAK